MRRGNISGNFYFGVTVIVLKLDPMILSLLFIAETGSECCIRNAHGRVCGDRRR